MIIYSERQSFPNWLSWFVFGCFMVMIFGVTIYLATSNTLPQNAILLVGLLSILFGLAFFYFKNEKLTISVNEKELQIEFRIAKFRNSTIQLADVHHVQISAPKQFQIGMYLNSTNRKEYKLNAQPGVVLFVNKKQLFVSSKFPEKLLLKLKNNVGYG